MKITSEKLKKNDESPEFYQYYPRLFKSFYEDVIPNDVVLLSEAGYLYYHSTLLVDSIIDEGDFSNIPTTMALQEEAIKILTSIYGRKSEFWDKWNERRKEYFEAVKIEKKIGTERSVEFHVYSDLADKKSAFGKVAIDSLWFLSKKQDRTIYAHLIESHKYFSIGFQLYDDFRDFEEDLKINQFNWGVYELKKEIDFKDYEHDYETIHKLFFIRGVAQKILKKSIENFEQALLIVKKMDFQSEWEETIRETWGKIITDLDITNHYIKSVESKIKFRKKIIQNNYFFNFSKIESTVIKNGLSFIESQFVENYLELNHLMYLGKIDGFENTEQVHASDTFQRAMLNDCLISVSRKTDIDLLDFLKHECDYLISKRNMDTIGGWGYFPTVKEIAADIDDLGQITQLFIDSGNIEFIETYCKTPIEIALSQRSCSNGGIETWIIPKDNQTEIQKKQEFFNFTRWGTGPDVEVVANFIYALQRYDSKQYKNQTEKALEYIIKEQNKEGFWESTWYYGNYYGTYVCLRLIKMFENNFSNHIERAMEYITNNQNSDGGFSLNEKGESDSLSTSFAILGLELFPKQKDKTIEKAKQFLIKSQNPDGSWKAINFIKPKFLEPYKSKTITTAFAMKALRGNV